MTYFIKRGGSFHLTTEGQLDLHNKLPTGNYVIKKDPFGQLYFELVDSFDMPSRVFGNTLRYADRILNTFHDRSVSTGVLLSGEKGSGKTLLAKMLTLQCAEKDIPTIIVNTPWCGDDFNQLIQNLDQPCIIMFDEFEKVYDREQQERVLTLLDGVFPTKKLFVLTCNDEYRIDIHMRNRPGRLFYALSFDGLEVEFIEEYCTAMLNDTRHTQAIIKIASTFSAFNFDMMKALVEEMNRYNENPYDAIKLLNAKPLSQDGSVYDITASHATREVSYVWPNNFDGNPLVSSELTGRVSFKKTESEAVDGEDPATNLDDGDDDSSDAMAFRFNMSDLVSFDGAGGAIAYKSGDLTVVYTKRKYPKFSFGAF